MKKYYALVLLLPFAFGCGVPKKEYNALETQLEKLKTDLTQTKAQKSELEGNLNEVKTKKEVLEEKTETYENLVSSLESEINDGKVKISQMKDRLTVNLIDKILFDSGSTKIENEGKEALNKIASVLKDIDDKRIQVEGHTDDVPVGRSLRGKFPTNWELSSARATSVVKHLAEMGVPTAKLSASAYSKYNPVADNDTEAGRSQNRRIEIVLLPKLETTAVSTTDAVE